MRLRDKLIVAGGLLVMGLVSWVVLQATWPAPEIVVSKETTWLTEPLADDGLPDYAGYLLARAREGVTPETNGAVPFLRAMWPAGLEPGEQQRVVCEEVGMEVPRVAGIPYYGRDPIFTRAFESWIAEYLPDLSDGTTVADQIEELDLYAPFIEWGKNHAWSAEEIPPLAEWVGSYDSQRQLLLEAARRPQFFAPSPSWIETPKSCAFNWLLPIEQEMHSAARFLTLHARLAIGEGDLEAAVEDCEAIVGLAKHVPPHFIVGRRISIALHDRAGELALSILDDPGVTPSLTKRLLAIYASQPPRGGIADSLNECERIGLLTFILGISQVRPDSEDLKQSLQAGQKLFEETSSVDWNIALRLANEWYDRLVAAAKVADWQEQTNALQQVSDDLKELTMRFSDERFQKALAAATSRDARSELLGNVLVSLLLPEFKNVSAEIDRSNAKLQLHTIAAALALYRTEHGEYPATLGPQLLETMPVDLYHGKPFVYRRTKEGYVLYSCGPNGIDNGGSNATEGVFEGYDIELVDLELTRENENQLRNLLGQSPVDEGDEEGSDLVSEIPADADDIAIRLPLPRLKLPLFPEN